MKRKALIVWGGWDGHDPKNVADVFDRVLAAEGFEVQVSDRLDAFADESRLKELSLIIPHWTCGQIGPEPLKAVLAAVESGVGIAGCHGGMGDAFRDATDWQFMVGGQFVAHPGGYVRYTVRMTAEKSPITEGIGPFDMNSEQYYMHVDPAVRVLATTRFPIADGPHTPNGPVEMPVVWTKQWGRGRVFYNALGHDAPTVEIPQVLELMRRGFLWAAR